MRLQMEMAEKLADGFSPHAAFEAKHKQSGHDQADEPISACLSFPHRRLRVAVAAVHRLEVTMHAAFGKSGLLRKASDALLPVFTHRVENDQALGPQSHSGGPCSEGWLKSCLKSALQSTRSTTHCPALETWPVGLYQRGAGDAGSVHLRDQVLDVIADLGGPSPGAGIEWVLTFVAADHMGVGVDDHG